jgi:hypothetical protein
MNYNLFKINTVARNNGIRCYANLYIRKIIEIVTLGIRNEGCRKYLDVQSVIGRIGLLRAFEISLKSRNKPRHE